MGAARNSSRGNKERNPFSSAFCNALLRYFWICYRHGVEDACRNGDIGDGEEAIVRLSDVREYGTVGVTMDWGEWQFKSLQWTREDLCRKRIMDLVMALRLPSHKFGYLLQIAKMYYVRGVRDWLDCNEWLTIEMVLQMPNYPYLLKRSHSFRPSQLRERFEFLQTECLNLIEMHKQYADCAGKYAIPSARLRLFIERVWSAMQHPKWFDYWDVETDAWDEISEDININDLLKDDYKDRQRKRRQKQEARRLKKKGLLDADKDNGQATDRRVSRADEDRGDVSADGVVLQSEPPKRRRGRPPKVL